MIVLGQTGCVCSRGELWKDTVGDVGWDLGLGCKQLVRACACGKGGGLLTNRRENSNPGLDPPATEILRPHNFPASHPVSCFLMSVKVTLTDPFGDLSNLIRSDLETLYLFSFKLAPTNVSHPHDAQIGFCPSALSGSLTSWTDIKSTLSAKPTLCTNFSLPGLYAGP